MDYLKRTWADISLDNLNHNYQQLRAKIFIFQVRGKPALILGFVFHVSIPRFLNICTGPIDLFK